MRKETDVFSVERRKKVEADLKSKKGEAERLNVLWQAGLYRSLPFLSFVNANLDTTVDRARLVRLQETKQSLENAKHELEVAQRMGQYERASQLRFSTIPDLERQLPSSENTEGGGTGMIHDRVGSDDISRVVAKATGIPVQNLLKSERKKLVHVRLHTLPSISAAALSVRYRWNRPSELT